MAVIQRHNQLRVIAQIRNQEVFNQSNLRGRPVEHYDGGKGRLSGQDRTDWDIHSSTGKIAYVITSWATPIAWVLTDGTRYIVAEGHSQSTRSHKRIVAEAFGLD